MVFSVHELHSFFTEPASYLSPSSLRGVCGRHHLPRLLPATISAVSLPHLCPLLPCSFGKEWCLYLHNSRDTDLHYCSRCESLPFSLKGSLPPSPVPLPGSNVPSSFTLDLENILMSMCFLKAPTWTSSSSSFSSLSIYSSLCTRHCAKNFVYYFIQALQ